MSDRHTPDPNLKQRRNWLRDAWQREEDDTTTVFAVLMAGVAMLFVAGIISAFMFARNDAIRNDPMEQRAERAATSATAGATTMTSGRTASGPAPPIARSEPATTGSRPQHDPREDEQLERVR